MKRITVLGAGTMGRQIAIMLATRGYVTLLYDTYPDVINEVRSLCSGIDNLQLLGSLAEAVSDSDLIIESIYEDLEAKHALYVAIAPYLKSGAVVASNTSSFRLHELAACRAFPNAIVLVHFFNPADIIPLVEVVKPPVMDAIAFQKILDLLKFCDKVPVVLKQDVAGFIANRLQSALLREACHLVETGVADQSDVDTVVREGIGLRWACAGPLRISDYGGLDIWSNVLENLLGELDGSVTVPKLLAEYVSKGRFGYKASLGFYGYSTGNGAELAGFRNDILRLLASRRDASDKS